MNPPTVDGPKPPRRSIPALPGVAVAAVSGILYATTLAPTVLSYGEADTLDSAMLQTGAWVLGIGHPTGYPTYMMLTHLFTHLPVGDPAYRANLASAVYGVAATFVVYLVGARLSLRAVAAAAGALAFGLSGAFWTQAIIAEVYTLEALLVALVLLALLIWRESRGDRHLLLASFLVGLSLTHHLTSVLLVPAALLFVYLVDRGVFTRPGLLLKGLGLALLGLLPLLYLPVRAVMEAALNEADPSTPGRLLLLVTGGSFLAESSEEGRQCNPSALALAGPSTKLQLFGEQLLGQFSVIFLLVGVLAAFYLLFTDRAVAIFLGTLFFGCVVQSFVYLWLGIEDFYVFLIPAWLALALSASVGLGVLLRSVEGLSAAPVARSVLLIALSGLMLALPLLGALGKYGDLDRSGDYGGRRTVEAVAGNAERGATVLHHRSSLWYMVLVEERRRDLTLIDPFCTSWDRHTDVVWPDSITAAQANARHKTGDSTGVEAAREAAKTGPVYVLAQKRIEVERFREAGFDVIPVEKRRLVYELVPRNPDR
ncbi:MAG: glycosyltransferase family 117 protein [Rubrobacter sp.]